MKPLTIGLFGFGVVGEGIYRALLDRPGLQARIKQICIRDRNKERNAPMSLFTSSKCKLLDDPEIDVIVELIDDAQAAFSICATAMARGKSVVSANKRMIAENLPKLLHLQRRHQVSFLYEAAVCGSIPVIRNLEEYFDNDLLHSVEGIVNGSTNYILSQMSLNGHSYAEILAEAQSLGFAESDPSLDVEGIDAVYKLSLILFHAFGVVINPATILRKGITALHPYDMQFAREKGWRIKLIARTKRVNGHGYSASVLPGFVRSGSKLFNVDNEYNGLLIGSTLADEQFLSGKGAGRYPTASAVLSDISAMRYGYQYEYRKRKSGEHLVSESGTETEYYVSYPPEKVFDKSVFRQVLETFGGRQRNYLIGIATQDQIGKAAWWNDPEVSVISMH